MQNIEDNWNDLDPTESDLLELENSLDEYDEYDDEPDIDQITEWEHVEGSAFDDCEYIDACQDDSFYF